MDTRTGEIYDEQTMREKFTDDEINEHFKPVNPTAKQMNRRPPKVGRNELCPCGSGRKFKKCCLNEAY